MSDHEWCRDVRRDEAVRAAEDAAAVPAIQHRDLPEAVADLRERVARLEAAQATLGSGDEIARMTAERDAAIRERDEARAEIEEWSGRCARVLDERDSLREKIVVMEGQSRMDTEKEIAVEEAWERCGIAPYWPDDEPGTSHRYAKSMEAEIVRLRARVAELEAAAAPAANAGGEQQPPRGWLTEEEREALKILIRFGEEYDDVDVKCAAAFTVRRFLDRSTPTRVPPPPRGWLTEEEREAVQDAADRLHNYDSTGPRHNARVLRALLARSTPPMVKVPHLDDLEADERPVWQSACEAWIAAIRAAGGEVEG